MTEPRTDACNEELWIALAEILGPRSPSFLPLIEHFGTPEAIFAANRAELQAAAPELGSGALGAILRGAERTNAAKILYWCRRNGVRVLCYDHEGYPSALRSIREPAVVLYALGNFPDGEKDFATGVVGTRHADEYGATVAYKLSFELAAAGSVIVSGMADGIDGIASAAAIDAGGRTVAVLGCGIDIAYPRHHARLMREIAQSGAVLTEYAPGTRPNGWNFPVRNRIISALSGALLVVEGGEQSGALITARYAALEGKPVFAVPGDITNPRSRGTNLLLHSGAELALSADDVLSSFRFLYRDAVREQAFLEAQQYSALSPEKLRAHGVRFDFAEKPAKKERIFAKKTGLPAENPAGQAPVAAPAEKDLSVLTAEQKKMYLLLPDEPFTLDTLTAAGYAVSEASATMTMFEIYGLAAAIPGGRYQKT